MSEQKTALEQPEFPMKENARRAIYWLSAFGLLVSTYLGAKDILDAVDMSFITGAATLVSAMAGFNTPKKVDTGATTSGTPLVTKE
jgi:hypothetical protein